MPKHEQVNYLIDEGDYVGKGGNCTISMVHHYLENHGGGEDDCYELYGICITIFIS